MGPQSRTRLSDFTLAHHSCFWKCFPGFLFPEPCSCAQNALCRASLPISLEKLSTAIAAAHSLEQRFATAPLLVRFRRAPKWGQQVPRAQTRLPRRRLQFLQRVGFPINALFGGKHVWEIFVSHWLPPPPRGGTPARVPKPLPCLGSPQAAVAASFRVQVQYCCNFSGKLKKKKELRAGGCEGERAKRRC